MAGPVGSSHPVLILKIRKKSHQAGATNRAVFRHFSVSREIQRARTCYFPSALPNLTISLAGLAFTVGNFFFILALVSTKISTSKLTVSFNSSTTSIISPVFPSFLILMEISLFNICFNCDHDPL